MLELFLRGLLFLGEAILELIFSYFFYSAGWLLLRLLTLGRYPRLPLRQIDPESPRGKWIAAFGVLCLVALPLTGLVLHYG
jgi:hypothetical protein